MFKLKKKYIAVWVVSEQGTYNVLKTVRFKPNNNVLRFRKGSSQVVDVSKPTYSKGLKLLYFVDVKKGQLVFEGSGTASIDPTLIDSILKQGIISQLTQSLSTKAWGGRFIDVIMGIAIGFGIGFIVAGFIP